MNSFSIEKDSMWGGKTKGRLISNESHTLAIILPGLGYNLDKALLDYSKQLILDLKFDFLGVEYGFRDDFEKFNRKDENHIREIFLESLDLIFSALELKRGQYKRIILIGKSLGTLIQSRVSLELSKGQEFNIKNIYLTPLEESLSFIDKEALIIYGDKDFLISSEKVEKLRGEDIKVLNIKGAGHSLCIKGDVLKSIDALALSIRTMKNYIEFLD